jgi:hypothetical protein
MFKNKYEFSLLDVKDISSIVGKLAEIALRRNKSIIKTLEEVAEHIKENYKNV